MLFICDCPYYSPKDYLNYKEIEYQIKYQCLIRDDCYNTSLGNASMFLRKTKLHKEKKMEHHEVDINMEMGSCRKAYFRLIAVVKFQAFLYLASHEEWYTTIEKGLEKEDETNSLDILVDMAYGKEMHFLVNQYLEASKKEPLSYVDHFVPFLKKVMHDGSDETKKIMGELFKEIDLSTREMLKEAVGPKK